MAFFLYSGWKFSFLCVILSQNTGKHPNNRRSLCMAVVVRKFENRDAGRVAEILFQSFKSVFKELWDEKQSDDGEHWKKDAHVETPSQITTAFVAVLDEHPVGFLHITANFRYGLGTLHCIGVDPGCFTRGVGKAMFAEADRFWKEHGIRKVYTCTSHINSRALAFYKSVGFEEEGVLKSHFFEGIDEIQLAKFYK